MGGSILGSVCHGSAANTDAVRAAIKASEALLAQLSKELDINPKTVAKRRKLAIMLEPCMDSPLARALFGSDILVGRGHVFGV